MAAKKSTVSDKAIQGGTAILGVYSSWANGKLAAAEAKAQGAILRIDADATRKATFRNEEKYRRASGRQLASYMTGIAKSGVRFEGSAAAGLAESAMNAEKNALEMRYNGLREAQKITTQANFTRVKAKNITAAASIDAIIGLGNDAAKMAGA